MIYATGSFWFSAAAMAAALVTLRRIRESDYLERTVALGTQLRDGLDQSARKDGVNLRQTGPVQMPMITFGDDPDVRRGYFWCGEMLKHGIYMHPWHNMFLCAAMTEDDVAATVAAADEAFVELKVREAGLEAPFQVALLHAAAQL